MIKILESTSISESTNKYFQKLTSTSNKKHLHYYYRNKKNINYVLTLLIEFLEFIALYLISSSFSNQ